MYYRHCPANLRVRTIALQFPFSFTLKLKNGTIQMVKYMRHQRFFKAEQSISKGREKRSFLTRKTPAPYPGERGF